MHAAGQVIRNCSRGDQLQLLSRWVLDGGHGVGVAGEHFVEDLAHIAGVAFVFFGHDVSEHSLHV